jgi:hypothetical protein
MSWSTPFESPIPLPKGKPLVTLKDAADYIKRLPKAEHDKPHWQLAVEVLILAAEDRGPLMHARIGMLQALNFGKPAPVIKRGKRAKKYRIVE